MAKISLRTMDYSPWGSKKLNRLKKFMQVEVDLKRMETKFGGRGFFGFGDIAPFCLPSNFPLLSISPPPSPSLLPYSLIRLYQRVYQGQYVRYSSSFCHCSASLRSTILNYWILLQRYMYSLPLYLFSFPLSFTNYM